MEKVNNYYIPSLDGLRFFAFLAVFLHHLPTAPNSSLASIQKVGWAGVDLFFVISACLFFRLLDAEWEKTSTINIGNFFIRRILRLYPLMIAFPATMVLIGVLFGWDLNVLNAVVRWAGLALFSDNFFVYLDGYSRVPYSAHLWTLSYEFQVYIAIPWLFLLCKRIGTSKFLQMLLAIGILGFAARLLFEFYGAPHPMIWVNPLLRPESVLVGLALSTGVFRELRLAFAILVLLLAAFCAVVVFKMPDGGQVHYLSYGPIALVGGALVWMAIYSSTFARLLSQSTIRELGKISFGLYVYHLLTIGLVAWVFKYFHLNSSATYLNFLLFFGSSLALTIAVSVLSYHLFELPFLRKKQSFTAIEGRPI